MKDLMITRNDKLGQSVDARKLHERLEINTEFAKWIKRRLEEALAIEGEDYIGFFPNLAKTPKGGRPTKEYIISIDLAKNICMLERTEIGKQVRKYFIERDKQLSEIEAQTLPTHLIEASQSHSKAMYALFLEVEKRERLELENHELAQTNAIIEHSNNTYTATQIAKDLGLPSAQFLNEILYKERIQYKKGRNWIPYAGYESWYSIKEVINNEQEQSYVTTRFTIEGKIQIEKLLESLGII